MVIVRLSYEIYFMKFELEDNGGLSNFEDLGNSQLFRFANNLSQELFFKTYDGCVDFRAGYHFLTEEFPKDIGRKVIKLEQIEPLKVREVK
jgi:hypothetical protein